jgi:hypothetical protein
MRELALALRFYPAEHTVRSRELDSSRRLSLMLALAMEGVACRPLRAHAKHRRTRVGREPRLCGKR